MFDVGQGLPSAYHRTKFESERIVREESTVPWRVYRPAVVVGHSETGAMDKIDGPYYFFSLFKRLRDHLPPGCRSSASTSATPTSCRSTTSPRRWTTSPTSPASTGRPSTWSTPTRSPPSSVVNILATAAKAPRFAVPLDRRVTGVLPTSLLPRALRPPGWCRTCSARRRPSSCSARPSAGSASRPRCCEHISFPTTYASRRTERALSGSGISCPDLEGYAATLWTYWEEHLDTDTARDSAIVEKLRTAAWSSPAPPRASARWWRSRSRRPAASRSWWPAARTSSRTPGPRSRPRGGTAHVYGCDLSDLEAIDALCEQLTAEHETIDFVVNNAGRSIRRSLALSEDRFHDFERTMQLNYFGAIRLVMGLLPLMREQQHGHVVNISSIGVQTNPPRFSAYVASKAALDAWSNVVASELVGDGVSFSTIHMPLVRTPMIAPTKIYQKFPTISPAQAADMAIAAMVERPHEVNTALGNLGAVAHTAGAEDDLPGAAPGLPGVPGLGRGQGHGHRRHHATAAAAGQAAQGRALVTGRASSLTQPLQLAG